MRLTNSLKQPLICGTLCGHPILAASHGQIYFTKRSGNLLLPENLAYNNLLEDVEITWKTVL